MPRYRLNRALTVYDASHQLPRLPRSAVRIARALRGAANVLEATAARRDFQRAPLDPIGAFRFACTYGLGSVRVYPYQEEPEIVEFLELVAGRRPARIIEIGTCKGGTLFLLTRVASGGATIVSVDLLGGPFGGGYARGHAGLLRSFARDRQKIHLVRGDSHMPATVKRVRAKVGGPVDLLFIDGDHSYEGVNADFENYRPLVGAGGLIAFHDIVPGPTDDVGGVPEFWGEVKQRFNHTEIVADWHQGGFGIGVIHV